MMIRKPAVAGVFYPDDRESLTALIDGFVDTTGISPSPAYGVISPHAGYRYSGMVAAKVYSSVTINGSALLIGPNHRPDDSERSSSKISIMAHGSWELATGEIMIDEDLTCALMAESDFICDSPLAHEREHSLEVQAPFLSHFSGDVKIAPLLVNRCDGAAIAELANDIYRAIVRYGKDVTLVASSDFSHYEPQDVAERQDRKAIEAILKLDGEGLIEVVRSERISMCGALPVALVIEVCKKMGAKAAELVEYRTSGDTTGDYSSVVGYAGFVIR